MTAPEAVADHRKAGSTIDQFDKAYGANEGEANECKADSDTNKGATEVIWFAMADSSDDDALVGKTMSEDGDDEERDKYLTRKDDWMYDELGIGGSNFAAAEPREDEAMVIHRSPMDEVNLDPEFSLRYEVDEVKLDPEFSLRYEVDEDYLRGGNFRQYSNKARCLISCRESDGRKAETVSG